jgi:hypothetical protein
LVTAATVAEGRQNDWQESINALNERVDAFAAWLHARPEQRIAVVGHGDFWQASIFSFLLLFFRATGDLWHASMLKSTRVLFSYVKFTGALTFEHFFLASRDVVALLPGPHAARVRAHLCMLKFQNVFQAFTRRVYGRRIWLDNCAWVLFEGPLSARANLTRCPT